MEEVAALPLLEVMGLQTALGAQARRQLFLGLALLILEAVVVGLTELAAQAAQVVVEPEHQWKQRWNSGNREHRRWRRRWCWR